LSDPARILIVRLSHLGDVVCTLGVHHALHAAYPSAEIAWVVQPEFAQLVDGLPGLERVFHFDRRGGWRAWPRLRRALRGFRPDLAVDAQGNLKSAAVTLASGAPRRASWSRSDWREPLGALVVNDAAPPTPAGRPHALDRVEVLARHVSRSGGLVLRTDPGLSDAEVERGEELYAEELGARERAILIHLSSTEDVRGWPLERWAETVDALVSAGRPTLVLSGPAEQELGRALRERTPGAAHRVGQRGLRTLAALFGAAARRGGVLVACDSGPMHVAWTVGLPVVLLAGPQDARRTGPWPAVGGPHRVVRAALPPDCAPCLARRCRHLEGPVCMTRIRAADVLQAIG
jgi:ADP-heptose:LPS heptosyltransferase